MISPARRECLEEAIYRLMYDEGAVFDRHSLIPAIVEVVLEQLRPDVVFTGVADDFDPADYQPAPAMVIADRTREQVLLDTAADIDELERIAQTQKRHVTDDEFVHLTSSGLFSPLLTRADFARYLRAAATKTP